MNISANGVPRKVITSEKFPILVECTSQKPTILKNKIPISEIYLTVLLTIWSMNFSNKMKTPKTMYLSYHVHIAVKQTCNC